MDFSCWKMYLFIRMEWLSRIQKSDLNRLENIRLFSSNPKGHSAIPPQSISNSLGERGADFAGRVAVRFQPLAHDLERWSVAERDLTRGQLNGSHPCSDKREHIVSQHLTERDRGTAAQSDKEERGADRWTRCPPWSCSAGDSSMLLSC